MKFTGVVTHVINASGTSQRTGKEFIAYKYRIEETGKQYPEALMGETYGDRVPVLEKGQMVEVEFSMACDEYQGNLYGKNKVWKVTLIGAVQPPSRAIPADAGIPGTVESSAPPTDDLPF